MSLPFGKAPRGKGFGGRPAGQALVASRRREARPRKPPAPPRPAPGANPEDEPAVLPPINGIQPDSRQEWRYAMGLQLAGWGFRFQVPIGFQGTAGSQRLDFLVYTQPRPTPVQISSPGYYHGTPEQSKDTFNEFRLAQQRPGWAPLEHVAYERLPSVQAAYATVMQQFGRGGG